MVHRMWAAVAAVAAAVGVMATGLNGQAVRPPAEPPPAQPREGATIVMKAPTTQPGELDPPKLEYPLGEDAVLDQLDARHVNSVSGYSFCPPAGTQRIREYTSASRVSWIRLQEKTGALLWALSVNQVAIDKPDLDPNVLAGSLAARLRRLDAFEVEKTEVGKAAGLPALHFRGGAGPDWQRQTWIQTQPGQFLVFRIAGPQELARKLEPLMDKCLDTLKLNDARAAMSLREKSVAAGGRARKGITPDKLASAIRPDPQWYLLTYKGRNVGFTKVAELAKTLKGAEGYAVRTWTMVELPGMPVRLLRREMWASPDLKTERWLDQWQNDSGKKADNGAESGILQDDVLVCDLDMGGGQKVQNHVQKEVQITHYLPRVAGMLLPRLLDLTQAASYSFVTYNGVRNVFEIRTFTVVGPATVAVGGEQVQAVKVTDQPSDDVEPATLYLAPTGDLLRMESTNSLVMERSSAAAVRKIFPKADAIVKALGT